MSPIQPPSKPPKAVAKRKADMRALATKLEKPSSWKYSVKKTRAWNGIEPATPCKTSLPLVTGCLIVLVLFSQPRKSCTAALCMQQ